MYGGQKLAHIIENDNDVMTFCKKNRTNIREDTCILEYQVVGSTLSPHSTWCMDCMKIYGERPRIKTSASSQNGKPIETKEIRNLFQNLEPNKTIIWTDENKNIMFKVESCKSSLNESIEDAVQQYNRLAAVTGYKQIPLEGITIYSPKVDLEKVDNDVEITAWRFKAEKSKAKDKNPKAFHNRLRKYRRAAKIEIDDLAEKLHIDKEDMLKIELGESILDAETLMMVGEILSIPDKKFTLLEKARKEVEGD